MSNLIITIGAAFFIVVLCLLMLGIGWVVTGKSKLRLGMCGRTPAQKKNPSEECGKDPHCPLCGKDQHADLPEESSRNN